MLISGVLVVRALPFDSTDKSKHVYRGKLWQVQSKWREWEIVGGQYHEKEES